MRLNNSITEVRVYCDVEATVVDVLLTIVDWDITTASVPTLRSTLEDKPKYSPKS
jgi:hypothetical protein